MEPGKHQSGRAEETGVYPDGNGLPAVPASSGSAAETGDAAAYDLSDSDQGFECVLTGQEPRVLGRSDVEVGEYDPTVRTGVWHQENDEIQDGSGLELTFESLSVLSDNRGAIERELRVEIPDKPERSFTIVDRGIFADFKELHYVAHGTFGVVLKATDTLGREVAIKVLTSERAEETQRFYNESTITAQLGAAEPSDRIIKVYARGTMDIVDAESVHRPAPYASMEFIDRTLSEKVRALAHLKSNGSRAEYLRELENALRVHLKNACMGIEYAHTRGIIHRDIKPDNIAISTAELGERTRILDWGLGKKIDGALNRSGEGRIEVTNLMTLYTANGAIVGSPPYMAPEQVDAKKVEGPRSDVYALGATMYEILTGEFPHKGTPGKEIILKKLNGGLTLKPIEEANSLIPRPLRLIVAKAMAADPERRYQSAAEMAADIERYYTGHQVKASEVLPLRERVREASVLFLERHKRPLTVATLLVGSIVPTAVWGISSQREQARAEGRAAAVSTLFNDVHSLPVKDADYGIRQIDSMLLKVEGERHELVTEEVSRLKAERERLQDFVDFRTAERQKYDRFVSEGQDVIGSMVFLFRDLYSEKDATHEKVEELLELFGGDKDPNWAEALSRDVFTPQEILEIEKIAFDLQIAAVIRVLPMESGNQDTRLYLADSSMKKARAERAVPYLERVMKSPGVDPNGLAFTWLHTVIEALKDGKQFPEAPAHLVPRSEVDFFVAAWVSNFVKEDYRATMQICREGLRAFPTSPHLYMMKSQALSANGMNVNAFEAAIRAEQYLPSGNKPIQLLKAIPLNGIVGGLMDEEEFIDQSTLLLELLNDCVSGSSDLDPAFRSELHFRRMGSCVGMGQKIMTTFQKNPDLMDRLPGLLKMAREDLKTICEIGLQYQDVDFLATAGHKFGVARDFEGVDQMLEVFARMKRDFPGSGAIIDRKHWQLYASALYESRMFKRPDLMEKYDTPRIEIMKRVLGSMGREEFLKFVVDPGLARMEEIHSSPEKYVDLLRSRARELKIDEGSLPTLPDLTPAPFTHLEFTSAKGPVRVMQGSSGLLWREAITLSNGTVEGYTFSKVKVEGDTVLLHDRSRNFWLKVTPERVSLWQTADSRWAMLYGK